MILPSVPLDKFMQEWMPIILFIIFCDYSYWSGWLVGAHEHMLDRYGSWVTSITIRSFALYIVTFALFIKCYVHLQILKMDMLDSPVHRNEMRVMFSKKRTHKNGFTNTDDTKFRNGALSNGYRHGSHGDQEESESEYYSDDEVFMEGINLDRISATKPLMHPRHRTKVIGRRPVCKCAEIIKPIGCFVLLVVALGSLMIGILYVSNQLSSKPKNVTQIHDVNSKYHKKLKAKVELSGCDVISVDDVWTAGFPKLSTESAIRMVDVNLDGILDVIIGFATGKIYRFFMN